MRLKIQGGTTCHSDDTLCVTCNNSMVIRGRKLDEEIITCNGRGFRSAVRITFHVTSCFEYTDVRQPSMMQLMENAWILRKGSKRRPAGFVHGRDLPTEDVIKLASEAEMEDDL